MRCEFVEHIARSRGLATLGVLAITLSLVLSGIVAQARVDSPAEHSTALLDQNATAKATGGGTVLAKPTYPGTVASFGINARRPASGGPTAEGRINYDRHNNTTDRHVNVPVVLMEASPAPQGPNQTGGDALLVGDCDAAGSTCPSGDHSAIVYVNDVSDSGKGQDTFQIYFCTAFPGLPGTFVPNGPISGCSGPEGDVLRSGNIQVRGEAAIVGEIITTAAGSGAYTSTPNLNGIELAGGTFGIGMRSGGASDLEAQFNGVNPLIGLFQQVTVTGWITTATTSNGTTTFSGTGTLDMGDGTPPVAGVSVTGSIGTGGLTLTVGSSSLGTLPMSDGYIQSE